MKEDEKIDEILEPAKVQVLSLLPGDVLVISVAANLSDEIAERIRTHFTGLFSDNKVVVVEDKFKFGVIRKTS